MHDKIAVVIESLEASQLAFLAINQVNQLITKHPLVNASIFYENLTVPCIPPKSSVMCINELFAYHDGIIITTNLDQTYSIASYPNNSKKIFYVWDLEWIRKTLDFEKTLYTFNLPERLITRCKDYADAIKNYCNREVEIQEDFNLEEILSVY
jgi:hypothetical protein